MPWKSKVNAAVEGMTGYVITRARPRPAPVQPPRDEPRPPADPEIDRLLRAPVFVLSPVRSGSTLFRVLLNSHSRIHAPHELHVRRIAVTLTTEPVRQAMEAAGHRTSDIEHILWDRLLHRELVRSGKEIVVDKTPSNVFAHRRITTCWPDARFVYLLRHPASIVRSWHEADPQARPVEEAVRHTLQYMRYLEESRRRHEGLVVRYETLVDDTEGELRRVCAWLGVEYEPEMIRYGDKGHGEFVKGIGDWRDKIRSGRVQRGRPLPPPEEVAEPLREIAAAWGYL
ncbi:sulfotransferase family protein [Microbispora amethystogenes]|uniref:Sulfotransferase family protein n=1 Tax=Microbispora amethystogenes TaxID=1427754 RepID=A0ABQ4F927_9ACTN|nr:sulfotransferase [Microbispora amethystogenes]GIH31269.1 sulfotransferase family protein [Microbispora amethystogenes]